MPYHFRHKKIDFTAVLHEVLDVKSLTPDAVLTVAHEPWNHHEGYDMQESLVEITLDTGEKVPVQQHGLTEDQKIKVGDLVVYDVANDSFVKTTFADYSKNLAYDRV